MVYFGSWLMLNRGYTMSDYFISLFGLMLSLTGLAAAMSGLTDADKAKAAAVRIFELTEGRSLTANIALVRNNARLAAAIAAALATPS